MAIQLGTTWVPTSGTTATTNTLTNAQGSGAVTQQDSLLVLSIVCRDRESTAPTVTDPAGNTWQAAGTFRDPGQSTVQHMFYALNAAPIDTVTYTIYGVDGVSPPAASHGCRLTEFTGVGGYSTSNVSVSVDVPQLATVDGATVTAPAGALVLAGASAGVTNRTLEIGTGWTLVPGLFSNSQMRNWLAWTVTDTAGDVTPQWTLAAGSSTSVGHITAVFTPANDEPDPDPDPDPVPVAVCAYVYNGATWQPLGHPTLTT